MPRFQRALALASMLGGAPLVAAPAHAHINMLEPAPRAPGRPDTQLSRGPCGQRANARREDGVRVFRPGQSIELEWEVYVQHVSYFRIAFDADGDDSFSARPSMPRDPAADDPTLLPAGDGELILDYIQDRTGDIDRVERRVTLPDVECERCTLQLIQFTYGLPIADATYHQCVDLVLDASAPGGDDEPEGSAAGDPDAAGDGAGCSLTRDAGLGGAGLAPAWLLPLVGGLGFARRRARRRAQGSETIHCRKSST